MTLAFALVASACGGFDNTPFRTGTVRGHLTEADPSVALVSLVGNPDVRSTVAGDGTFVLEHVPAGQVELFIVASAAGFPVKKTEACVKEGESREVKIQLPGTGDDDQDFVNRGRATTSHGLGAP